MKIATLDAETTTLNKGNPFDPRNRLCSVGILFDGVYTDYEIEYGNNPYGDNLTRIANVLGEADLIVGFNLKFDLHWLRRYINDLSYPNLWDTQYGEYLLSNQTEIFPGLNDVASRNGLGSKHDVVANEYWAKGIDTPDIPYDILSEYLRQDVYLTDGLYQVQRAAFDQDEQLYRLFRLGATDQRWLLEAEENGLYYDVEESLRKAEELRSEFAAITDDLTRLYDCPHIDWNSSDHISVVLFGGSIYVDGIETYQRQLKRGLVWKTRKCWVPIEFPQQIRPDPRTECDPVAKIKTDEELERVNAERREERKKPFVRTYSVAEGILRNYTPRKKAKHTIELLLRRSELNKLLSTYYEGIPDLMKLYNWEILHGTFNQVGTRTGRLSSSKPNLQNFAGDTKYLFRSRYPSNA